MSITIQLVKQNPALTFEQLRDIFHARREEWDEQLYRSLFLEVREENLPVFQYMLSLIDEAWVDKVKDNFQKWGATIANDQWSALPERKWYPYTLYDTKDKFVMLANNDAIPIITQKMMVKLTQHTKEYEFYIDEYEPKYAKMENDQKLNITNEVGRFVVLEQIQKLKERYGL